MSPTARARPRLVLQDLRRLLGINVRPKHAPILDRILAPERGRRIDKARRPGRKNVPKRGPEAAPKTNGDLRLGREPGRHRALRLVLRLQQAAVISPTALAQAQLVLQDLRRLLRVNVPPKQDGSLAEHGLRPHFVQKKGAAPTLARALGGLTIGRALPAIKNPPLTPRFPGMTENRDRRSPPAPGLPGPGHEHPPENLEEKLEENAGSRRGRNREYDCP
jgi:hypothetical protein